ncbi:MAG: type II toxin-antitoxin system VapC family toxin [Blastocatellia bacterium]|nr:type II toxin-antitoxin system VapC family toxin [Blastocatellia bacterium]
MSDSVAFWDTSAIIPLCCNQEFSFLARRIRRTLDLPVVWWGTPVEVHSGIERLRREDFLNEAKSRQAIDGWQKFHLRARKIRPDDAVLKLAMSMPAAYKIRALDAFQLAAALRWCGERPRSRPFVSADYRLCEAAGDAGFDVVSLAK